MNTISPKSPARILLALATLAMLAARAAGQTTPSLTKQQTDALMDSAWELESRAEQTKTKADYQAAADAMEKALAARRMNSRFDAPLGGFISTN